MIGPNNGESRLTKRYGKRDLYIGRDHCRRRNASKFVRRYFRTVATNKRRFLKRIFETETARADKVRQSDIFDYRTRRDNVFAISVAI